MIPICSGFIFSLLNFLPHAWVYIISSDISIKFFIVCVRNCNMLLRNKEQFVLVWKEVIINIILLTIKLV